MSGRPLLSMFAACGVVAATVVALTACGAAPAGDDAVASASTATDVAPQDSADRAFAAPPASSGLVVTIGDSIMAGLGLDADEAWPALIAHDTGADVVNLACSGAGFTIAGDCGDDYADLVAQAIALHPEVVIIQSSDNDLDATQDEIDEATRAAIDELRAALPDVQLIGIGTLWHLDDDEPDEIGWATDALESAVTDDDGAFVSIGQPLRGHPELLQWDGEHPNAQGQIVLSEAVESAFDDAGLVL